MPELETNQLDQIAGGSFWSTRVIRVKPKNTDTIHGIAAQYEISVEKLLHDNPCLKGIAPTVQFGHDANKMNLVIVKEQA